MYQASPGATNKVLEVNTSILSPIFNPVDEATVIVPKLTLAEVTVVKTTLFFNTLSPTFTKSNKVESTVKTKEDLLVIFVCILYNSVFHALSTATSPNVDFIRVRQKSINSNSISDPSEAKRYFPSINLDRK